MHTVFTDYFDQLLRGEEPDVETFVDVERHLRSQLVGELRRRSLWTAPPAFLGVLGTDWRSNRGESLQELSARAHLYLLERLEFIANGRQLGRTAESQVAFLLKQMLTDLQRKADPVGNRIFRHLRDAVAKTLAAGELYGLEGDTESLTHNTLLTFDPDTLPEQDALDPSQLVEAVESWAETLLPDLVTALGKKVPKVVTELRIRILELRAQGFLAFHFGDLVKPLQREVRKRWRGVWTEDAGEMGFDDEEDNAVTVPIPLSQPSNPVEIQSLDRCVTHGIGRYGNTGRAPKERDRLFRLWIFLRGSDPLLDPAPADRRGLSKKRLGELLGIPRARLNGLFGVLQGLAEVCLQGFQSPTQIQSTIPDTGLTSPNNDDRKIRAQGAEY